MALRKCNLFDCLSFKSFFPDYGVCVVVFSMRLCPNEIQANYCSIMLTMCHLLLDYEQIILGGAQFKAISANVGIRSLEICWLCSYLNFVAVEGQSLSRVKASL